MAMDLPMYNVFRMEQSDNHSCNRSRPNLKGQGYNSGTGQSLIDGDLVKLWESGLKLAS